MQAGYRPELDISPVLGPEQANYFQSLIGILRWAVELGHIDIHIDVALLSSHLAEPAPRGHVVQMNAFVDANHAGNKVTRRSHTGIIIYLNCSPIVWYSKAQTTVESSTFGSEFVAMRIMVELLESMRYKLIMMGVPIDGPANVFCDNQSVVTNSTVPTSTLKKKHNSIAYHHVREAVAAGVLQIAKVQSAENLADLLTKSLSGTMLKQLIQKILW